MINKLLILLASTFVFVGCSTTDTPVVRQPGTFTAITFPVFSELWVDGVVQMAIKNKNGCGVFSPNYLLTVHDTDFSVDIEGNQDIFFHVSRADAQIECNKIGTFYATKGNVYTLNLETKNKQCEISLLETKPNSVATKIKTYPSHVSIVDTTKVCENKDKLY